MLEVIGVIKGVFTFWSEIVWLVKLIQGTPEAHREKLLVSLRAEADNFERTGRPTW